MWVLCALVLGAELVLSFARPIWLLSALATVLIVIVYVRALHREGLDQDGPGIGPHASSPDTPGGGRGREYDQPRAQGAGSAFGLGAVAVFLIGLVILILTLTVTQNAAPPQPATLLRAPLLSAQVALPALPPTDSSATVSFNGSQNRWVAGPLTLSVKARPGEAANARLKRALVLAGFTSLAPKVGPDGSRYLRFSHTLGFSFAAKTPSLTAWTATTTIALGVPDGFPLGSASRLLVRAPSGMLASTQPASKSTFPVPGANTAVAVVPFDSDTAAVSIKLNGWIERHGAAKSIAGFVAPILIPSGIGAALWARLRRLLRRKREGSDRGRKEDKPRRRNGRTRATARGPRSSGKPTGRRRPRH